MDTTLYIPKTLVIGFQQRSDTYTGKLAYVIYKDHTGKLRKEKSWNGWRDHKIDIIEVENVPTPNFTLNKGVQRSREWFGTGRSMVRVWDPRDFEFEITVDNLLNVLMHSDVSRRDITEPCVYAWQGQNLILLPTNSVEYQESIKHTEKQSKKVSARDLVPGRVYSIKANASTEVMYLGRLEQFEVTTDVHNYHHGSTGSVKHQPNAKKGKAHVFIDVKTKEILVKDPSSYLAGELIDYVHDAYGAMLDHYYGSIQSQPVIGASVSNHAFIAEDEVYLYRYIGNTLWFALSETEFVEFITDHSDEWGHRDEKTGDVKRFARYVPETSSIELSYCVKEWQYGSYDYFTRQRTNDGWKVVAQRDLPGLSANDPRVIEFSNRVKAMPKVKECRGLIGEAYYAEQRRRLNEHLANAAAIGAGYYLTFRLADGKLAHNYQL